jgi:signal transduction histidine kinase/DNA-binding NarL/FixJ family response regulator
VRRILLGLSRLIHLPRRTRSQRRARTLAIVGFGSVIIFAILYVVQLNLRLEAAISSAQLSAQNLANALAEHTARTFEALDRTLHGAAIIRRDFEAGRYPTPEAVRAALRQLKETQPAIIALGWTDAKGNLLEHTYPQNPPRASLADLPHFIAQRNAAADEFYVSPPIRSAATGRWITAISRRVSHADGSFAGIVVAPLDPEYFTGIYRSLRLGDNGSVALIHPDATVMARVPFVEGAVGQSLAKMPLFSKGHAPPENESVSPVDGVRRLFGYKVVPGLGMVVFVTYDRSEVVEPVYQQVRTFGPLFVFFLLLIISGVIFLIRQTHEIDSKTSVLEATLANMDQGLIVRSADGTLPIFNQRALDLLGFPRELMGLNRSTKQLIDYQRQHGEFESLSAEDYSDIERQAAGKSSYAYERKRPNGTVLEVRGVAMPDGGMLRTYADVTARKAAEETLREAKLRAEAATQAKTEFLANMSHELRTPLTAILGISELLLQGNQSDEQRRGYLEKQLWAGRGLLALINDILDFSKIEAGQLTVEAIAFSLHADIDACMNLIAQDAAKKGISTSIGIAADVPDRIIGDPTRLRQVLTNLLSNAVKFTERGNVRLAVERLGAMLRFSITDTGIGIPADTFSSLFQRFSQGDGSTTRHFGGTGLGLVISKRLVELMGGQIEVTSELGRGSTFSFTIQLREDSAQALPAESKFSPLTAARYRILLAEDNETNQQLIATVLQQAGHEVVSVGNGDDACKAAGNDRFDAILMDVQMPVMDGYAATRVIRAGEGDNERTVIIALTANALPDEAERCRQAGMDFHTPKPIDWPQLFGAIDRLVTQSNQQRRPQQSATGNDRGHRSSSIEPVLDTRVLSELRALIGQQNVSTLLRMFEIEAHERFSTAPEASGDLAPLLRETHSFGGSAAMLGFTELAKACRDLPAASSVSDALAVCRTARDRALAEIEQIKVAEETATAAA